MVVLLCSRGIKVISSLKIMNYYNYLTNNDGFYSEHILNFFAVWLTKFYNATLLIPRWLLVFGSGTFASLLLSFLHKSSPKPPATSQSQSTASTTTASLKSTDTPAQSGGTKRTGAKQRKPKS